MITPPSSLPPNATKGLLYLLAAVFMFECVGLFAKLVLTAEPAALYTVIFARSFFAFIILSLFITVTKSWGKIKTQQPRWHGVRGLIGFLTLLTNFYAMKHLDLGTLTALQFTMPLFMMLLAVFWLKEQLTPARWIGVGLGFAGMLMVSQSATEGAAAAAVPLIALLAALASALLGGLSGVIIRKLTATDHSLAIALSFAAFSTLLSAFLLLDGFFWLEPRLLAYLAAAGVAGGLAQLLLTEAYRHAPVSVIAPYEYSSLLWAMSFSYLFWDKIPTGTMLLGAVIIIAADLYVLHFDKKKQK